MISTIILLKVKLEPLLFTYHYFGLVVEYEVEWNTRIKRTSIDFWLHGHQRKWNFSFVCLQFQRKLSVQRKRLTSNHIKNCIICLSSINIIWYPISSMRHQTKICCEIHELKKRIFEASGIQLSHKLIIVWKRSRKWTPSREPFIVSKKLNKPFISTLQSKINKSTNANPPTAY